MLLFKLTFSIVVGSHKPNILKENETNLKMSSKLNLFICRIYFADGNTSNLEDGNLSRPRKLENTSANTQNINQNASVDTSGITGGAVISTSASLAF